MGTLSGAQNVHFIKHPGYSHTEVCDLQGRMVLYQLNIFTMNLAQRIENIIKHSDEGKYEGIVIILKN